MRKLRAGRMNVVYMVAAVLIVAYQCGGGADDEERSGRATPSRWTKNGSPTDAVQSPTLTPAPTFSPVRFVALGDTGTGESGQFKVAAAVADKCSEVPCDFGVLLGDNFYSSGVTGADDPQWESKFQEPYGALPFPFYAVLGNHGYGINGDDFSLGANQVAYSGNHSNWIMPAEWYAVDQGPATLLAVNSTLLVFGHETDAQEEYFKEKLASAARPWTIVLTHHPYVSNGYHGNAGSYGGHTSTIRSGKQYKAFVDEILCGNVDLYLSGHDHNLQVLPGTTECPGLFVVTGAGAFSSGLPGENPSLWQERTTGFAYVVVTEERVTIEMIDASTGTPAYTTTLER